MDDLFELYRELCIILYNIINFLKKPQLLLD